MFFKANEGNQVNKVERLYIFEITFATGMQVVKIGKSSGSSSLDRMLSIQRDYYHKYRTTFLCRIKRDRVVEKGVFQKETELHNFFKEFQYRPKAAFDGSTELFCVPLDSAVEAYEWILDGNSLDDYEYELPESEPEDQLPF